LIEKNKHSKKFYSTVFMAKSLQRRTAIMCFTPAARQPTQRMDTEIGALLF